MDAALPRDPLSRRLRIAALVIAVVGTVLIVTAIVVGELDRPKLTAKTLVRSVEYETGSAAFEGRCRRRGTDSWSCEIDDRAASGEAIYAVEQTSGHCWRARLAHLYGEPMPRTASGCVR